MSAVGGDDDSLEVPDRGANDRPRCVHTSRSSASLTGLDVVRIIHSSACHTLKHHSRLSQSPSSRQALPCTPRCSPPRALANTSPPSHPTTGAPRRRRPFPSWQEGRAHRPPPRGRPLHRPRRRRRGYLQRGARRARPRSLRPRASSRPGRVNLNRQRHRPFQPRRARGGRQACGCCARGVG